MIMERPSSAWIWHPLLEDRPKDTLEPNADSTADWLIAWQTALGLPSPPLSPPLSSELLAEVLGSDDEEEESDGSGESLGDAVTLAPPWTSEATAPVPVIVWAQAAVVQAASSKASPARIRRAVMYRSSLVVRVVRRRIARRLSAQRGVVIVSGAATTVRSGR
jgi:hypothetical protein